MDTLDKKLTEGCDKISKMYCKSYNQLVQLLDRVLSGDKGILQEWDLSSLGLYLCKCVEQEVNSSLVQLMRKYLGIEMPKYYCRVAKGIRRRDASVNTGSDYSPHFIGLNDYFDSDHRDVLKRIPLGDAYHAMTTLLASDENGWFNDYPFLKNARFQEIWRTIFTSRNRIAHAGAVIRHEDFLLCFSACKEFLENYMPLLASIKKNLTPAGWKDMTVEFTEDEHGKTLDKERWALETWRDIQLPLPTIQDYYHREALDKYSSELFHAGDNYKAIEVGTEMFRFQEQFNWLDIPFEEDGLYGLKDIKGDIVIPAKYDDFADLQHYFSPLKHDVTIAIKDGKMGLVRRYTGEELTGIVYDGIENIQYTPFYYCSKDGSKALGILDQDGKEVVPCIIDGIFEFTNRAGFPFKSGDKYGYFSIEFNFYVPPIYDDIQIIDLDIPIIFIIDGVEGYISDKGVFYSIEQIKKMDEDEYDPLEFLMEYEG